MRYEDVHGKIVTLTNPQGQPVKARVVGCLGKELGCEFRFLTGEETGWPLGGDTQLGSQLQREGWTVPEIEATDIRNHELHRLARLMRPHRTGRDEWRCGCGKFNTTAMTTCARCGSPLQEAKRKERPLPQRGDPATDPHLPHTTKFQKRDIEHLIPPEAKAVIDQQWPEVVRTMQQYDMGAGMLMLYGLVRDACKAAGWPDSMAYQMRDYLIDKMNKAKVTTYTGSDDRRGDFQTFKMGEALQKGQRVGLARSMWGHKAGTKGRVSAVHAPTPVNSYTAKLKLKGSPHMSIRPEDVVEAMLDEHCGHCGTPTEITLKPQDIDLGQVPKVEKRMGKKVEKEHVKGDKAALAVAAAHWNEDPKGPKKTDYYRKGKARGLFPEL